MTSIALFDEHKLSLGLFGTSLKGGLTVTTAENTYDTRWDLTERLVRHADRIGLEIIIPVGRWKGFGGPSDFHGNTYETFTWAAGVAAATQRSLVAGTIHVPVYHPIVAAKMATTIDHISGGRFAMNVVAGWNEPEFEMFGRPLANHDDRYATAREWIELVRRLWSESEPFDYTGEHYTMTGAISRPKPIRQPSPPVLFAGFSPTGQRFAAQYADVAFVGSHDLEASKGYIDELRRIAREDFGREIRVYTFSLIVCRDTEGEARRYYDYCVHEKGDWEAGRRYERIVGSPPEMREQLVAGIFASQLIGTPEMVVEKLARLPEAGYDGTAFIWVDYEAGLRQLEAEILPLMVQAGLRSA